MNETIPVMMLLGASVLGVFMLFLYGLTRLSGARHRPAVLTVTEARWIPVEERLPDDRRRVIVWIESVLPYGRESFQISRCNKTGSGYAWDIEKYGGPFSPVLRVTHWLEAPQRPKVRETTIAEQGSACPPLSRGYF